MSFSSVNFSSTEQKAILDRFLRYVKTWTTSDSKKADQNIQPSTEIQFDLAKILSSEMQELGLKDITTTEHCYTYAFLPATKGYEDIPPICLLAHIDTVEEVSGKNVQPQIHEKYDGTKIILKSGDILDPETDKALALAGSEHETIVTSDGTTLLGADDKAGVAAIMTALEYLSSHTEIAHPKIEVIFSPDEETGHGMDNVPLELLESKCAYTVDGGHIGELETECFNAYKADVSFTGVSTHTGTARGILVNAVTMLSNFISNLPRHEAPETTDGYQGFYAPMTMEGSIETACTTIFLRDFTTEGMQKRINLIKKLAEATAESFGGKVQVTFTKQYENMKEGFKNDPKIIDNLVKAYRAAGVEPVFIPIRGGTDGSRLTEMGIPTPNIFTGGHNYHSRTEWLSLEQMCKASEILVYLAKGQINA